MANIHRDLETLHLHKWLTADAVEQIIEMLGSEKSTGSHNSMVVSLPKQNGVSARRHTVGGGSVKRPPPPKLSPRSSPSATALYDNDATEEDDLPFSAGDTIADFEKGKELEG